MRIKSLVAYSVILVILSTATAMRAQKPESETDKLVDRIVEREKEEVETIRQFNPIVETYLQEMKPHPELGSIPVGDHYFLGIADFSKRIDDHSLLGLKREKFDPTLRTLTSLGVWGQTFDPAGFLAMIFVDTQNFDRDHYHFEYVRREFLGEVRCLVMDVMPLSGNVGFDGRIWVNEQDYTIVRFNGAYEPGMADGGDNIYYDSWRSNLAPGLWLPTYVYSEETDIKRHVRPKVRFKSQTRLWGYNVTSSSHESEFSELRIDSSDAIKDQSASSQDSSPLEAKREWQHTGEDNVVDRLQRSGLLAAPGPVDKVLETVVNNIEVTNNLDIQPELRCRVLLTSTLESFSIGHTIVISRGLLDVLPDEASLAVMLAEQLGSITLFESRLDKWGFNSLTNIPIVQVIATLNFRQSVHDREMANDKAVELVLNSPYKDKLTNAGLFLKQLDAEQRVIPYLVHPTVGNRVFLADKLMAAAPTLQPRNVSQTAALPLGARIKLNPWNDEIQMVHSASIRPQYPQEKMPFEITPFEPFLTYFKPESATVLPQPQGSSDPVGEQGDSGKPLRTDSSTTTASH